MANYLYNGIELPALPEWDKEKYPYALINGNFGETQYHLIVTSEPAEASGLVILHGVGRTAIIPRNGSAWVDFSEESNRDEHGVSNVVWSNHDICNEDGTLYLAASYPIDAETREEVTQYGLYTISTYTPTPSAMVMGMLMGQAVRRMRK